MYSLYHFRKTFCIYINGSMLENSWIAKVLVYRLLPCMKGSHPCRCSARVEVAVFPLASCSPSMYAPTSPPTSDICGTAHSCFMHRHNVSIHALTACLRAPVDPHLSPRIAHPFLYLLRHKIRRKMAQPNGKVRQRAWKPKNRSGCKTCK
jgi:hypothetical protein